jgi:hypothetical protein
MRAIKLALLTIGLAALAACIVPSVHSLFADDQLIEDPGLIGRWAENAEKNAQEYWKFETTDEARIYRLTMHKDDGDALFAARLGKIGEETFMDLFPVQYDNALPDWTQIHLMPVHSFWSLKREGDTLTFSLMDIETWKKLPEAARGDFKQEKYEGEEAWLLTGSAEELQKTIAQHRGELFSEPTVFARMAVEDTAATDTATTATQEK